MSTINDGGPAFPVCYQHKDVETGEIEVSAANWGMSLRDWFAGKENLADWDTPDTKTPMDMCEALAGPIPKCGWNGKSEKDWIDILTWQATWRSRIKYIRADAMLKARGQ